MINKLKILILKDYHMNVLVVKMVMMDNNKIFKNKVVVQMHIY